MEEFSVVVQTGNWADHMEFVEGLAKLEPEDEPVVWSALALDGDSAIYMNEPVSAGDSFRLLSATPLSL